MEAPYTKVYIISADKTRKIAVFEKFSQKVGLSIDRNHLSGIIS
jgi:hypothetical protein